VADESNRVLDLFLAALEQPTPADRAAFLDDACATDSALRRRLDELLRAHDRPDPVLDRPAADHFPDVGETLSLEFLEPGARPDSLGRLGHYEVLEVGGGGMGIVLRAFDEKLHRVVAVKVLAPVLAGSGSARQRFVREARAAAAVTHDNVIAIHAVEDAGRSPTWSCSSSRAAPSSRSSTAPARCRSGRSCAWASASPTGWPRRTATGWCTGTSSRPTSCWRTASSGSS
jgi:hypothetical protein